MKISKHFFIVWQTAGTILNGKKSAIIFQQLTSLTKAFRNFVLHWGSTGASPVMPSTVSRLRSMHGYAIQKTSSSHYQKRSIAAVTLIVPEPLLARWPVR